MFWAPGTAGPGSEVPRLSGGIEESEETFAVNNQWKHLSISQQRTKLPIYGIRTNFLYCVERYRCVVLLGETGCGKTTQIPQYLHESGWTANGYSVCCTQPRRVAAVSVAHRVANEMGVPIGSTVGFAVRFEEACSTNTKIKYMTDGMLVRETMMDPLLSSYSCIMVDEVHERSIHTDILLGLLKKIQKRRPELRLIIASATLNVQQLINFFETNQNTSDPSQNTAIAISVEGRVFPVQTFYTEVPVRDYVKASIETVLQIHKNEPEGGVLVFLTGQEEIETAVRILRDRSDDPSCPHHQSVQRMRVLPLYSSLPAEQQMRVFEQERRGVRKVVIATNIAETSITLSDIVHVVDCGFVKVRAHDALAGVDALVVTQEANANAEQRKGRAGRTQNGKCYRLFTEDVFLNKMAPSPVPEIQRTNLNTFVLQLKSLGIDDLIHFHFLSPPPAENLAAALEQLYALGAIDSNAVLTSPIGTQLAEFPVDPCLAKMIVSSGEYSCANEMLSIAAMLSVQNIFVYTQKRATLDTRKREFAVYEGDHLTYLNVYTKFKSAKIPQRWCDEHGINLRSMQKVLQVRDQLFRFAKRFDIPIESTENVDDICKSILCGFFMNTACKLDNNKFRTIRGDRIAVLHPWSVLSDKPSQWITYHEIVMSTETFLREVTTIKPEWLSEVSPAYFGKKEIKR